MISTIVTHIYKYNSLRGVTEAITVLWGQSLYLTILVSLGTLKLEAKVTSSPAARLVLIKMMPVASLAQIPIKGKKLIEKTN